MICHFYIRYKTNYGQSLVIRVELGEGIEPKEYELKYLNNDYWSGNFDTEEWGTQETVRYQYILREQGRGDRWDLCRNRNIQLKKIDTNELYILDDWQEYHYEETVFSTKPFSQVFEGVRSKDVKTKKPTHVDS